jgi:soluble lytic murein transglycosylase
MRFSHFATAARLSALVLIAGIGAANLLAAQPGMDPAIFRPSTIRVLSAADHDLYTRAFLAASRGDWSNALALGNQGQDSVARQLLQWRYALDRNSGAKFAEIDAAIKMAEGWPQRGTLYARAEQAIPPEMSPAEIVQWFAGRTPASSIGRVRLGEALVATGDSAKGAALIRQGWSEGSFDDFTENSILAKDAAWLTPEADRARLDALLWRDETTPARRQMARVDAKTAAVAQARIALGAGLPHAKPYLAKMADSADPALLYDWSRQLRLEHQDSAAHAKLLAIAPESLARDHTAHWWAEVNAQARDALKAGDPRQALALIDHAMLPKGDEYAEQQFLGGFINLRFLKDPSRALTYFRNLAAAVSRPISKSRAEYWQGRAYEALGDSASAYVHYRLAASYPETFYGQLAMAHTQSAPLLHMSDTAAPAAPKAEIENDPLMPAIKVLADLGLAGDLRLFADREAQAYPASPHLKQLLRSLVGWGYPEIALRLAKSASYAGTPMVEFAYPTLRLPAYTAPGTPPQPALVHALIRQETEFDPYAVSLAGARGLMQMMLPSAKKAAKDGGLPYRPGALLTDTAYNIQLGMIEYAGHLASWGGSNVLAAAAYNAGPSNVKKWLEANGDPRTGADPVDWIEQIPFSETRNYVQRVLENLEVYRGRLAAKDLPLQIMTDVYAPLPPPGGLLSAPVSATAGPAEKASN